MSVYSSIAWFSTDLDVAKVGGFRGCWYFHRQLEQKCRCILRLLGFPPTWMLPRSVVFEVVGISTDSWSKNVGGNRENE